MMCYGFLFPELPVSCSVKCMNLEVLCLMPYISNPFVEEILALVFISHFKMDHIYFLDFLLWEINSAFSSTFFHFKLLSDLLNAKLC